MITRIVCLVCLLARPVGAQEAHATTVDRPFAIVAGSLFFASAYDAESTFRALARSASAREANPIMQPFVSRGRPATYAFLGAVDVGILAIAAHLKHSDNAGARRLWWLLPIASTAAHGFAGLSNQRIQP